MRLPQFCGGRRFYEQNLLYQGLKSGVCPALKNGKSRKKTERFLPNRIAAIAKKVLFELEIYRTVLSSSTHLIPAIEKYSSIQTEQSVDRAFLLPFKNEMHL